jgi:predicted transposase YbfD/YdcC
MVSAWASTSRLVLAQVKVDDKSNEITALPELLRQLAINGCVVTSDAMGCQREIAEQIVAQEADYVLALKANQPDLLEEVVDCFTQAAADGYQEVSHQTAETITKGHGRLELRHHTVLTEPTYLAWLQEEQCWPGVAGVGASGGRAAPGGGADQRGSVLLAQSSDARERLCRGGAQSLGD